MLSPRLSLHGLFAVLLALAVQIGAGATVPRTDPLARLANLTTLCDAGDHGTSDGVPTPHDPLACLLCPACVLVHAATVVLIPEEFVLKAPQIVLARPELPPPATAPPSSTARPFRARAPPILS
ncbi:MAG: hypothetical protein U1E70_20760 [Acetobacteraceae bacterium]|nr:hypothetical protein [Pseudomonadota bacterium]